MKPEVPSIEVSNLTKRFRSVTALDDVSFQVAPGEIVGFLGPNGAGKSTTMRILSGLVRASSGSAKICGIPVASKPEQAKLHIGYMPENNPLPEDMRVIEYLRLRACLKEIPRKIVKSRIQEVMEICDLDRKTGRKIIRTLSKGFKQRVGIADAILAEPEVVIMDEPTIGLDPHQILSIRDLISSLRGKMAFIISSHILAEVELYCDRVIIINKGHIVASGTSESLKKEFIDRSRFKLSVMGSVDRIKPVINSSFRDVEIRAVAEPGKDGFYDITIDTASHHNAGEAFIDKLLHCDGVRVRSLSHADPTLEDIFLAATKRSWKEQMPVGTKSPIPDATVRSEESGDGQLNQPQEDLKTPS